MRPVSRAVAAIEILDDYLSGIPVELVLKRWFRNNRFAGSNDRNLIRDIIFEILRRRKSLIFPFESMGYKENGRLLTLSYLADHYDLHDLTTEIEKNEYFFNPPNREEIAVLSEKKDILAKAPSFVAFDYPPFLANGLFQTLGKNTEPVLAKMQERAPLYLRVNSLKNGLHEAQKNLVNEGILCSQLSLSANALQVTEGRKLVKNSKSYSTGMVEIQDLSSQIMTDLPEIEGNTRILDYCAGGGGKTLAIASKTMNQAELLSFDINQEKLFNLRKRTSRAGAKVRILKVMDLGMYRSACDVVFVDSPCSGSGTWRRDPEAKWDLTENKLKMFIKKQAEILGEASQYVRNGGIIVYVVCSLLPEEGDAQVKRFLSENHNFQNVSRSILHPLVAGDGFFRAVLKRIK